MSSSKTQSKILFLLSGSIAAFKAAQVISRLTQQGHTVQVAATGNALKFVGAATLEGLTGRKILCDLWENGRAMDHIELTRWADYALLCPASANTIAKMAHGFADDLVCAIALAWPKSKPFFIFPAMNTLMLNADPTQANLQILEERGYKVAATGSGSLACGETGEGRLMEPEDIFKFLNQPGPEPEPLPSLGRILITAGATREPIDGIRFISNVSTGQTGANLADGLAALGWKVTFLHGQGAQLPRLAAHRVAFSDFHDLERKLKSEIDQRDYIAVIHGAAVSDYSVESANSHLKMKSGEPITLNLKPNHKILPKLKAFSRNSKITVIGFKLTLNARQSETLEQAQQILTPSVDAIVANDWSQVHADRTKHPGFYVHKKGVKEFQNLNDLTNLIHAELKGHL